MLSGHIDKPFIMQEATFWRRELWDKVGGRLDTSFHLAADTELWLRFFRTDHLYLLDALLAGFRQQNNNRSIRNIEKYHEEARSAISRELASLHSEVSFEAPPPPINVPSGTCLRFAETFGIPLFKPNTNPLWRTYLNTVEEWILKRQGGLESAPIFRNELDLWGNSEKYDIQPLNSYLQACLDRKKRAEDLIQLGETRFFGNDLDGALQATFEALDIWPTSADGNNNLGVMLYHKGKVQEAIEYLVLVTQHDVSKREAYRNLAVIFHELGQRDKVQWAMNYYLSWFPEDAEMKEFYRRLMECP